MERIELPTQNGPWSFRAFNDRDEALRFSGRLTSSHPSPFQLTADALDPSGVVLRRGTWVVFYEPIIRED